MQLCNTLFVSHVLGVSLTMYSDLHHSCGCGMFHGCTINYQVPSWENAQTPPVKLPELPWIQNAQSLHGHWESFLTGLPASRLSPDNPFTQQLELACNHAQQIMSLFC